MGHGSGPRDDDKRPDELARRLSAAGDADDVGDLLGALLMAADESFFYADLGDGSLTWSRGVEIGLGYPPNAVGRTLAEWRERVHPDDRDRVIERVRAAMRDGARIWTDRLRVARADGTYASVRVRAAVTRPHGRGVGLIGAMTVEQADDRDEMMREIADLRERSTTAERRSDLLARAQTSAVYEWDPARQTVTFSEGVRLLFGYPAEPVEGGRDWWLERVHPDDRGNVIASFERFLRGGQDDRWVAAYRFRCADGRYVRVRDRAFAIHIRPGEPSRVIGAVTLAGAEDRPVRRLTKRQAEVLDLVRAGGSNKRIGARLGISEQAVKGHISGLLRRFGVPNRAALVGAAERVRIEVS